jgi:uncharacterized protein YbjT (DUF2867 family)
MSTAAIVGASGLVGREVLALLRRAPAIDAVHVLGRRAVELAEPASGASVIQHQVDFDRLAEAAWPHCDLLFCCLGTTIRKAGSQAVFRTVDFDYVVESARAARQAGATRLLVVSAMGADPDSRVFYNRVKGDMERAVAALGYESVLIFRPALLSGERAERRPAEKAFQAAFNLFNPLLPRKYRSLPAAAVARAMVAMAGKASPGVTVVESDRMQAFKSG